MKQIIHKLLGLTAPEVFVYAVLKSYIFTVSSMTKVISVPYLVFGHHRDNVFPELDRTVPERHSEA